MDADDKRVVADLETALAAVSTKERAAASLRRLEHDPVWLEPLLAWIEEGIRKDDGRWELRTASRALARVLQPRTYLEIGVRRGWSLVQVLDEAPDVHAIGCDPWLRDYAGVANPGPSFVHAEVSRAAPGFSGRLDLITGPSHDRLPVLFATSSLGGAAPGDEEVAALGAELETGIDLVTIDGDHSAEGAWRDIVEVLPRVSRGGAVVLDDIAGCVDAEVLRPVWERLRRTRPDWHFLESPGPHSGSVPGTGIAIRA